MSFSFGRNKTLNLQPWLKQALSVYLLDPSPFSITPNGGDKHLLAKMIMAWVRYVDIRQEEKEEAAKINGVVKEKAETMSPLPSGKEAFKSKFEHKTRGNAFLSGLARKDEIEEERKAKAEAEAKAINEKIAKRKADLAGKEHKAKVAKAVQKSKRRASVSRFSSMFQSVSKRVSMARTSNTEPKVKVSFVGADEAAGGNRRSAVTLDGKKVATRRASLRTSVSAWFGSVTGRASLASASEESPQAGGSSSNGRRSDEEEDDGEKMPELTGSEPCQHVREMLIKRIARGGPAQAGDKKEMQELMENWEVGGGSTDDVAFAILKLVFGATPTGAGGSFTKPVPSAATFRESSTDV